MARKHGLGRGLSALIPGGSDDAVNRETASSAKQDEDKNAASGTGTGSGTGDKVRRSKGTHAADAPEAEDSPLQTVRLARIEPDPTQPRKNFPEAELQELADSIREHGLLQPIIVTPQKGKNRYTIVAGERRWRACQLAGLKEVQVIVRTFADPGAQLEASLIENIQREDLNPIEEAQAYQRLMTEFGLTQEETAQKVSRSRAAVANALRLLKLAPGVQQFVIDGQLSMGHARALLPLEDPTLQQALADRIVKEGLSVREVEKLVKNAGKTHPHVSRETDPSVAAAYQEIQDKMQQSLGMNVRISYKNDRSGKVEISFTGNDDLEKLMGKIF